MNLCSHLGKLAIFTKARDLLYDVLSHSVMPYSLQPYGRSPPGSVHGDSPGKNT